MSYRSYPAPHQLGRIYDPARDLPLDHLARLVEQVVEESITVAPHPPGKGQPPFDPRLCLKVLIYGYATGIRSSRVLQRLCEESLPYLFLTRGDTPSYRTLCSVRVRHKEMIEAVWLSLFTVAGAAGLTRVGRLTLDSTKFRANASSEAVVKASEFQALQAELERVLAEAAATDAQEEEESRPGTTRLEKAVPTDQMRDVLRRVRARLAAAKSPGEKEGAGASVGGDAGTAGDPPQSPSEPGAFPAPAGATTPSSCSAATTPPAAAQEPRTPRVTPRMRQRLQAALAAVKQAREQAQKFLCLTDPDAVMMPEGREKRLRECHSFEVAVDQGLIVAGGTSQEGTDAGRLLPLVRAAAKAEPTGVKSADADSGYYSGEGVAALLAAGIDTCIPDSNTACDLHRGWPVGTSRQRGKGRLPLTYEEATDSYHCPEGKELRLKQQRHKQGAEVKVYRAVEECTGCARAAECLVRADARHKTVQVPVEAAVLEAARQRFRDASHQQRYRQRAEKVEGVFGFLRGTLGVTRWLLRGKERVESEGALLKVAYQMRKVHQAWAGA